MNPIRLILLLFTMALAQIATPGGVSLELEALDVKKVIDSYHRSKGMKSKVTKEVYQSFSEETEKSEGTFLLRKGSLRLDLESPEKSVLVITPKTIWYEEPLDQDFEESDKKIKVTKIKAYKALAKSNAVLALLLGHKDAWKSLELKSAKSKKSKRLYTFVPSKKKNDFAFEKIEIALDKKKKKIISFKYWDSLENTVSFSFEDINLKAKISSKMLSYKPPKSAQVTEI